MSSGPNALWAIWDEHPVLAIKSAQLSIKGWSLAALRTNFYINELKVMLDAGLSANIEPEHIFITHGHSDHCANLPFHLYTKKEVTVYIPRETIPFAEAYIKSMFSLTQGEPATFMPCKLIGVDAGQVIPGVDLNGRKFDISIIDCDHSVPCRGYGFTELRKKLNPEFAGKTGAELGALRKAGVTLDVEVQRPLFCFMGDTGRSVLTEHPEIFTYETVMIECTFITDDDYPQSEKTKHMHWRDLKPVVIANPQVTFILYHFSQRYKKAWIEDFFATEAVANVVPWASG